MTALVLAEIAGNGLDPQTGSAVTAALALGAPVDVLVAGSGVGVAAEAAARLGGVRQVLVADDAELAHHTATAVTALLEALAPGYDAILAPASSVWRDALPRLAARLDVQPVTDIVAVLAPDTFRRPVHAGAVFETVRTAPGTQILTIRASAFAVASTVASAVPIASVPVSPVPDLVRVLSETAAATAGRPDLGTAKIIVSGGRGLGSRENFDRLILPLAEKLGAAIGASRAAVDAGYAASALQVGQTGRIVAPELYIAVGISGAIQHLAGMKASKLIVAINSDPLASIFSVADYGLVGDLFEVVPALTAAL